MKNLGLVLALALPLLVGACGTPPPDRLEIVPPTPFRADELGQSVMLTTMAYRGVLSYVEDPQTPLQVKWTSNDPAVAAVDAQGKVTSTGTGKAKIQAAVLGAGGKWVTAEIGVQNLIVGSVTATGDFPKVFKLDSKPVPLTIVVKNEKGVVVEKPNLRMSSTDYCAEVTPAGVVYALAVGECSIIIEVASKTARIDLDVKE